MTTTILERLEEARKSGEILKIIYHGGSQPGTVREVSPVVVRGKEIRARDIATGFVKIFKLSKIEIPVATAHVRAYDPNAPILPNQEIHQSIQEALSNKVSELELLGWIVAIDTECISLYRYFKNGKPRKTPDISLSYAEFVDESYFDPDRDDMVEEKRKSTRPYRLVSPSYAMARTFTKLSSAIELFLQEVSTHAPTHAT